MATKDFPFVVSSGPTVPKDAALRTLIRKQAMKGVGIARKKRANYGRVNTRQIPPADASTSVRKEASVGSDSSDEGSSLCVRTINSKSPTDRSPGTEATTPDDFVRVPLVEPAVHHQWTTMESMLSPLRKNPPTAYEALRIRYQIDIQDLSILATFNIGQTTMTALADRPELLTTLLGHQMSTYLQFIPSRYGHNPALTAVTDCVVAKVHSALYPQSRRSAENCVKLYLRALRAVQNCIADKEACLDPDLLCAVEMLSLYEIVDRDGSQAYLHHIDGCERMIRHRTPAGFKSEFEQKLFLAHIGPAFDNALAGHKACYLAEPQWTGLYKSLIQDTVWLTERSELVIEVRAQLLRTGGLLNLTNRAMTPGVESDGGLMLTAELKARSAQQGLLDCLDMYRAHLVRTAVLSPDQRELSLRREIYGSILECLGIFKRIIAAVCEDERLALEVEIQDVALKLLELKKQPAQRHSWLYGRLEYEVASILQETRRDWEVDVTGWSAGEKRLAACRRWETFNHCFAGPKEEPPE